MKIQIDLELEHNAIMFYDDILFEIKKVLKNLHYRYGKKFTIKITEKD